MNYAIKPEIIYQIIDNDILFIDIRDPSQFQQQHIKNFQNISSDSIFSLPKDKPICLICYSGKRTEILAKELNQLGYNAYYIEGGFQAFLNLYNLQYY